MTNLKANIRMIAGGLIVTGLLVVAAWAFADEPVHTKTFVRQAVPGGAINISENVEFVEGSSAKLQRSEDSIWIKINTTQLPAGAYTVWAVIFNNPTACTHGVGEFSCGPADLPGAGMSNADNNGPDGSVFWATSGVVDETGVGHFRAFIEEGLPEGQRLRGTGLNNAEGAEVHFIIRYHGPLSDDPDTAISQLTTSGGGCNIPMVCYEPQAGRFRLPE